MEHEDLFGRPLTRRFMQFITLIDNDCSVC